jgi:hypothetical protein
MSIRSGLKIKNKTFIKVGKFSIAEIKFVDKAVHKYWGTLSQFTLLNLKGDLSLSSVQLNWI